jgi:hypothetical protein
MARMPTEDTQELVAAPNRSAANITERYGPGSSEAADPRGFIHDRAPQV